MKTNPNTILVLFVSVILIGYFFKRIKILQLEDSRSIINLILYFTLPAVVLKTFYKASLSFSLLLIFLASLGFGIMMTIAGIFLFKNHLKKIRKVF